MQRCMEWWREDGGVVEISMEVRVGGTRLSGPPLIGETNSEIAANTTPPLPTTFSFNSSFFSQNTAKLLILLLFHCIRHFLGRIKRNRPRKVLVDMQSVSKTDMLSHREGLTSLLWNCFDSAKVTWSIRRRVRLPKARAG